MINEKQAYFHFFPPPCFLDPGLHFISLIILYLCIIIYYTRYIIIMFVVSVVDINVKLNNLVLNIIFLFNCLLSFLLSGFLYL